MSRRSSKTLGRLRWVQPSDNPQVIVLKRELPTRPHIDPENGTLWGAALTVPAGTVAIVVNGDASTKGAFLVRIHSPMATEHYAWIKWSDWYEMLSEGEGNYEVRALRNGKAACYVVPGSDRG